MCRDAYKFPFVSICVANRARSTKPKTRAAPRCRDATRPSACRSSTTTHFRDKEIHRNRPADLLRTSTASGDEPFRSLLFTQMSYSTPIRKRVENESKNYTILIFIIVARTTPFQFYFTFIEI